MIVKRSAFKKFVFIWRERETKKENVRVGETDNADKESTVSTLSVLTAGSSYVTWSGTMRFFRTAIQSCALQSVRVDDCGNRWGCFLHAARCPHDPCTKTSFLSVRRGSGPIKMVGHCTKHRNLEVNLNKKMLSSLISLANMQNSRI